MGLCLGLFPSHVGCSSLGGPPSCQAAVAGVLLARSPVRGAPTDIDSSDMTEPAAERDVLVKTCVREFGSMPMVTEPTGGAYASFAIALLVTGVVSAPREDGGGEGGAAVAGVGSVST